MTAEGCRAWREQLGAFVLGGLDEREQAAVRAHVEGCAACRAEVEALRPVAALLARADASHLDVPDAPPAGLGRRVLARVRQERRARRHQRYRVGLAFAGAAAAIVLAVVLGFSLGGGGPDADRASTVSFDTGSGQLRLSAALEPRPWGTEIHMYVHGARRGTLCRVWLRGEGPGRIAAGSFRYRYEEAGDAAVLTAALPPDRIRAVGLEVGARTYTARVRAGRA